MKSVVLSLLLCTLCIHQGYSKVPTTTSYPDPVFDPTNHKACLAEQKLDISVLGISDWKDFEDDRTFFHLRKTLDESKRNTLLACLYHHKPMYGWAPLLIQTEDGRYELNLKRADDGLGFKGKCKAHERDLIKYAGCYYDLNYDPMRAAGGPQ